MKKEIALESEWKEVLFDTLKTKSFKDLFDFVQTENKIKKIFPKPELMFQAFALTPFSKVRVVILGQDPYHNDGQANGLSFSVEKGTQLPPSLKNIYKEIEDDVGIEKDFTSGNLKEWASQGVFLLNAILTVCAHKPTSHHGKGWEIFTDTVIQKISDNHEHVVFILWGNYARSKKILINTSKHLVLEASHPSPFSAHKGFFGCKHFSKCNEYLEDHGQVKINW